jgi:hypothetical protein
VVLVLEQQIKDMVVDQHQVLLHILVVVVVLAKLATLMETIMVVMVFNHPLVELLNIMRVVVQEIQIHGFQHLEDKVVVVQDGIQEFLQIQKYNLK